jgi:hypothetical protein
MRLSWKIPEFWSGLLSLSKNAPAHRKGQGFGNMDIAAKPRYFTGDLIERQLELRVDRERIKRAAERLIKAINDTDKSHEAIHPDGKSVLTN